MALNISNYSLKVKHNVLLDNVQLNFNSGTISHIVGKNGVGKSRLAKDIILNLSGYFPKGFASGVTVISSYSNIPDDITTKVLFMLLSQTYSIQHIQQLISMLSIENIPQGVLIKQLSPGQKQKLKLISFLLEDKEIIILDEITNSLDKITVNEIHQFLNAYIKHHPHKIVVNITNNLDDLHNVAGDYYLFSKKQIQQFHHKDELINQYVEE